LRRRDLVDEVQVDVQERGLPFLLVDDVCVPDLLEQGARHNELLCGKCVITPKGIGSGRFARRRPASRSSPARASPTTSRRRPTPTRWSTVSIEPAWS